MTDIEELKKLFKEINIENSRTPDDIEIDEFVVYNK